MDGEKKLIFNKEEYPSNSYKNRETRRDRKKIERVATAKRVKKPFHKRFTHAFMDGGEPGGDVANYILYDVIIPAAKSTIADLVEGAIDMILFGGTARRSPYVSRNRGRSYVSYNDAYSTRQRGSHTSSRALRPHNVEPARVNRHDFTSIVFGSRGEAETVLGELAQLVADYGSASVADFYDLAGITSD